MGCPNGLKPRVILFELCLVETSANTYWTITHIAHHLLSRTVEKEEDR